MHSCVRMYGKDNQVEALKGISLDINKGDIYGIIGMSGAGKSTLVRCLNYLEKPTTGTVVVEDQDLSTLTEAELRKVRTGIAMIFQHFNLLMPIPRRSCCVMRRPVRWIPRRPRRS